MSARESWDEYFMQVAQTISTRATCDRKRVGAVLVRDKVILSSGYNGSIKGLERKRYSGQQKPWV